MLYVLFGFILVFQESFIKQMSKISILIRFFHKIRVIAIIFLSYGFCFGEEWRQTCRISRYVHNIFFILLLLLLFFYIKSYMNHI